MKDENVMAIASITLAFVIIIPVISIMFNEYVTRLVIIIIWLIIILSIIIYPSSKK